MLLKGIKFVEKEDKAVVFGYGVKDPDRYGVVSFDHMGQVKKIVEKPKNPDSIYAVVGLYFYPNDVIDLAKSLEPSERGELEISSVNQNFLDQGRLNVEIMGEVMHGWILVHKKRCIMHQIL